MPYERWLYSCAKLAYFSEKAKDYSVFLEKIYAVGRLCGWTVVRSITLFIKTYNRITAKLSYPHVSSSICDSTSLTLRNILRNMLMPMQKPMMPPIMMPVNMLYMLSSSGA